MAAQTNYGNAHDQRSNSCRKFVKAQSHLPDAWRRTRFRRRTGAQALFPSSASLKKFGQSPGPNCRPAQILKIASSQHGCCAVSGPNDTLCGTFVTNHSTSSAARIDNGGGRHQPTATRSILMAGRFADGQSRARSPLARYRDAFPLPPGGTIMSAKVFLTDSRQVGT
jgi:hypothetical protein